MKKTAFFFLIIFSFSLSAAEREIRIATPEWTNQTNSDGTGLYFDIIRAVYEAEGYRIRYSIVPWGRALYMVESGKSDVMPGDIKSEYGKFTYPKTLFLKEVTSALFKKDSVKWNGISTLSTGKCLWLTGYGYQKTLGIDVEWFEIDTREAALKSIVTGRCQFYIDAKIDLLYHFEKHPDLKDVFETRDIYSVDLYLKFSRNQRGQKLADIYDRRIKILKNDAKFREIFKKYGYDFPVFN